MIDDDNDIIHNYPKQQDRQTIDGVGAHAAFAARRPIYLSQLAREKSDKLFFSIYLLRAIRGDLYGPIPRRNPIFSIEWG